MNLVCVCVCEYELLWFANFSEFGTCQQNPEEHALFTLTICGHRKSTKHLLCIVCKYMVEYGA